MRIGELSSKTGVSRDALRLYERRGMLASLRTANGYRDFPEGSEDLVNYIKTAQTLGFTLAQIGAELPALTKGGLSADEIGDILRAKLAEIDKRISGLNGLRAALAARLDELCPLAIEVQGETGLIFRKTGSSGR
ncbi:MAG: MerR family DNA-binding transcriptional regulator [Alphaproteobacteria bacterium]|nr:MerR family DNA-binding transcriptional regulator [Alphaproteobacteria bacterium]